MPKALIPVAFIPSFVGRVILFEKPISGSVSIAQGERYLSAIEQGNSQERREQRRKALPERNFAVALEKHCRTNQSRRHPLLMYCYGIKNTAAVKHQSRATESQLPR
ncbi:Hypothetical predicted protein [Podarcis lilfordi]|uniref:Uncharacterized protein n=1 Tax=Podarcis lilfordi TaxID=74358 RepID=A0AA35PPH1_9SAUR|nr:Hypothetical predicted protein [Podarcis lilfordi]